MMRRSPPPPSHASAIKMPATGGGAIENKQDHVSFWRGRVKERAQSEHNRPGDGRGGASPHHRPYKCVPVDNGVRTCAPRTRRDWAVGRPSRSPAREIGCRPMGLRASFGSALFALATVARQLAIPGADILRAGRAGEAAREQYGKTQRRVMYY